LEAGLGLTAVYLHGCANQSVTTFARIVILDTNIISAIVSKCMRGHSRIVSFGCSTITDNDGVFDAVSAIQVQVFAFEYIGITTRLVAVR
jgi:hypothetical protein